MDIYDKEVFVLDKNDIWRENASIDCKYDEICDYLRSAKRPVIVVGGGVRLSDSTQLLKQLCERTHIPVVTTLNGFDAYHNKIGFSGLYGMPSANISIRNADLILALGTRFGNRQVGKKPEEYSKARIVHVDCDAFELKRVFKNEVQIQADIHTFIKGLLERVDVSCRASDEWNSQIEKWKKEYDPFVYLNDNGIDPVRFVEYVSKIAPEYTIYTNDVGQNEMWVCQGLKLKQNQRLLSSSGYGSMGFSIPAAIGSGIAEPNACIVSFMGDGGFQMNMQELQFIKIHKMNIKCCVFNNNTLGMMRDVQRIYYNSHFLGSDTDLFQCPDLERIAWTYSMKYIRIEDENDYYLMEERMNNKDACIIDVRISIDSTVADWGMLQRKRPELAWRV